MVSPASLKPNKDAHGGSWWAIAPKAGLFHLDHEFPLGGGLIQLQNPTWRQRLVCGSRHIVSSSPSLCLAPASKFGFMAPFLSSRKNFRSNVLDLKEVLVRGTPSCCIHTFARTHGRIFPLSGEMFNEFHRWLQYLNLSCGWMVPCNAQMLEEINNSILSLLG